MSLAGHPSVKSIMGYMDASHCRSQEVARLIVNYGQRWPTEDLFGVLEDGALDMHTAVLAARA